MKTRKFLLISLISVMIVAAIVWGTGTRFRQAHSGQAGTGETEREREREQMPAGYLEARAQYEFDMLKDPVTGKIPTGIFEKEKIFARNLPERTSSDAAREMNMNSYLPAGPNNVGGRTRAVAYDVRYNGSTNRVIIAGCVSGGIMRSDDGGLNWNLVTPENDIHSYTALVQDPRPGFQNIWYAGGGEAYGNSAGDQVGAPYLGYGLWKSTDNGLTWTKLTFTIADIPGNVAQDNNLERFDHPFDLVHRLAVNPVNGDLYIACHRRIVRSTNGGSSFQTVFGGTAAGTTINGQTEVAITLTGKILIAMNGGHPDQNLRGVWVSQSGALGSYIRIAGGQTPGVDSVTGWRGNNFLGSGSKRILISLAPSDNNIAYIFYQNGLSSDAPDLKPEADLFRLNVSGNTYTWTNLSENMPDFPAGNATGSDPLTVQGGYDMVVAVKPDDPNTVFVAGTNLYRSTNGFTSTANTSWINGYQTNFTYALYPGGHPDIHNLVFNPSNPAEAICSNDGGIQKSVDITATAPAWSPFRNYQTLQYYYVAMDPDAGRNNFAGGAQDNGTYFRDKLGILPGVLPGDSNRHIQLVGGDGCAVGISKINVSNQNQFLYGGSQYGNIQRVRLTNGVEFASIRPNGLTTAFVGATNEYGEFVTNFRVNQDNAEQLYYVNFNRLFRTTSASSVTAGGWTELTGIASAIAPSNPTSTRNIGIRALAFSRGPYLPTHALYLGTTNGRIYRLDDPQNAVATQPPANITPSGLSGNVQDIAVNPNNDEEILAVVSNYNVTSIFWTTNAKAAVPTWVNVEGNLTLPSVRSCAIVVKKEGTTPVTEYYVGTSVGLYSTVNLSSNPNPTWAREGGKVLNFAVTESIVYRPVDNVLLLGTHGNGMFYTFIGTPNFNPGTGIPTGIDPVVNDPQFIKKAYPTITSNTINYQVGHRVGIRKIRLRLFDMKGREVYSKELPYQNGNIPVHQFPTGSYILVIESENGKYRFVQKLIRE